MMTFAFGVVFLVLMVVVAICKPNPTAFQRDTFRIVLALSAAGVAAMLPGFIDLKLERGTDLLISTGGALAVFIVVYFLNPASGPGYVQLSTVEKLLMLRHLHLVTGKIHGASAKYLPHTLGVLADQLIALYTKLSS